MKGSDLFRTIADDDLKVVGVKLTVGGSIEIDLDTAQRLVDGKDNEAVCVVRCRVQGAEVNSKSGAAVKMKVLKDSFKITDVHAPPPEPEKPADPQLFDGDGAPISGGGPDGVAPVGDVLSDVVGSMEPEGEVVDGELVDA